MTIILPKQKQAILQYLKEYIAQRGYAPTLTEIAKRFELSSLATVHEHLEFLEQAGFIRRGKAGQRSLTVIEPEASRGTERDLEQASVLLPIVGAIAAGSPIEAIEDRDTLVAVPRELVGKKNAYLLKVRGDSMVESLIADGDIVVVEKTEVARDGDTVVALLDDGSATLKQFFRGKNFIRLQPANPKYKPLEVKNVVIQGKVIGVLRKY